MIIPLLLAFSNWALLALRLAVAAIFWAHGWPKLKNLKGTQEWFGSAGFRPGWLWGTYVALLETLGALMLILGVGTQIVAALFAGQMAVAVIWKKMLGQKLSGGYELDLLLVAAGLALATMGGGALALVF